MNKKFLFVLLITNISLMATKNKIDYCSNYYQNHFNEIISHLFQSNNQEIKKYQQTKNILSFESYLNYVPYNKEIIEEYISMLFDEPKIISNIKNKRKYNEAKKDFIKNVKKLLLNIVLINDIDLYQKYAKLDEIIYKYLKLNIVPNIFIYIWNKQYKYQYNKDMFAFDKISEVENMIYLNNKKIIKEINKYYPYLIYYSKILNNTFALNLLSDKKTQSIVKKIINKKLKNIKKICFSSEKFKKMKSRHFNLNNQEIFELFNIYVYLNKSSVVYHYVMDHKIENHLWIYLDAIYNVNHNNLERAYKELLILLNSEPKNNFLAKLTVKTSVQIISKWNKDPNNYYKNWFYLSELFERIKNYKDYLLKDQQSKKELLYLLEVYQKNSVILKEYWMNKNIPDNVIMVHNKTKYYLDFFANK